MTHWVSLPTVFVDRISLNSPYFSHFFHFPDKLLRPSRELRCLVLIDAYALSGTESSLSLTYPSLLAKL